MAKEIIEYLEQLEISENVAKLYLILLEISPTPVTKLAKKTGISRTAAYMYIDQLIEKGLAMELVKGSRSLVAATQPEESLQYLIEQKIQKDKAIQEKLPDIVKTINTSLPQPKESGDAEIKYYKGETGVKKIYQQALKAKELRSYVNIAEIAEVFPENFSLFDNAFKQNPTMKMFEIVEDSPQARERVKTSSKREKYSYKMLPEKMKFTAQDILIYDDKVAIIHFKDKIHGVLLYNTDLYNNFKVLFEYIWNTIP